MNRFTFKGNRWFKCDLHLHTTGSKCFHDQSITPEQWVARAIEQGLDCVAVTDHNCGDMINSIKAAASGTGLTVFPGVEITCDTSKVHLLVLFDIDKTTDDINDFLIRCEIDRAKFADQLASTTQNIFEVAEKANEADAIILPAHIDEFNGLGAVSNENLKTFFDLPFINAVHVVHKPFTDPQLQTNNNEQLRSQINEHYGNPAQAIDYSKIGEWHRPVKIAVFKKLAITTFSDNPHEPKNSKHGLDGIGRRFTWIKMGETPTLEGLRQAFFLPDFRVKNDFTCTELPYKLPELWFKSISISNTNITDNVAPLTIEFSPQLTTIIGGRGSGKSSILRFIRGLFNRTDDILELTEIIADHNEFYKLYDPRSQKGVISGDSIIEISFVKNGLLFKLTASSIINSINQTVRIQKYDSASDTWLDEESERYIELFKYEHYSQKQIYEIAQEPNSLRERIDKSIVGIDRLKQEREVIRKSFLEKCAGIRTMQQQISDKGKIQAEIKDIEERIQLFQQTGFSSLIAERDTFIGQKKLIEDFILSAKVKEDELQVVIDSLVITDIDYTTFEPGYQSDLGALSKAMVNGYANILNELLAVKQKLESLRLTFEAELANTLWKKNYSNNESQFESKKSELIRNGIDDITNFELLRETKSEKQKDLEKILAVEASLTSQKAEKATLKEAFLAKTKEITALRKRFVEDLLQDDKVKLSINAFRNKLDFINKLRTIIQRPTSFESDVETLKEICFNGNVEQGIERVRETFLNIRNGEEVSGISGYFVNLVNGMSEAQLDEIELLLPEDEIEIRYKPSGSTSFKPLSIASAGQKTTAILTFILSYGDTPLLLDQPEDDLDNRLVYELIVDRLKQAKEHRQIIVVTHNANIPVNGDAEFIVSMNSDSRKVSVLYEGTIEESIIKKEICDVMEGSQQAFDMRSRRYSQA